MTKYEDVKENLTGILMSAKDGVCPTDIDDISDALSLISEQRREIERLRDALQELAYGGTEQAYRTAMKNAPCHNSITDIDGCARCGREIKAIRALAPLLTESKTNGDQDHG